MLFYTEMPTQNQYRTGPIMVVDQALDSSRDEHAGFQANQIQAFR
jgi:hypothetical protein